ncbi:MAG: DUF4382 domain-containing protein [Acidobacteriaceae bacterium]
MISDPAAYKSPAGPLKHVWITIADIKASTNPDARAGDSSFVDLTPGLSAAPQQVDLLGQADSQGFLGSLSVSKQIPPGDYRQVRVFLAPDTAASTIERNACGASYSNCVVPVDNSLRDLQLPPSTAKGIVISPNEIAHASIGLNAGDQSVVDVDFDTCSSILQAENGAVQFNPVIHVGVVSPSNDSIRGTVVSSATGQALLGGTVVVALEQKDSTGTDRIVMRSAANSDGTFKLQPVPQGTYDLVAVGVDGANVSYSAGVETGIQAGQLAGIIPLVPGSGEGTLQGLVTTQSAGPPPAGVSVAVQTSALQALPNGGPTITVPLLPTLDPSNSLMLTASTTNGASCPAGVDCGAFSMHLPATAPNVVACSEDTAKFTQQGNSAPDYAAESFAQIPGSGGIAGCVSTRLSATATPQGRSLVINPNGNTTAATLAFTQCGAM